MVMPVTELGSVQKALLLPLWGRAVETRKARPLLVDQTAVRIVESIGYDFSTISRNISFITRLATLLSKLASALPGSEILFDACSPRGLEMANRKVIKAGGMDDSAILRWGIQRAKDVESWDSRIAVVEEYPLFQDMRRAFSMREKWGTFMSDALRIMSMVHLRLGGGSNRRTRVGEAAS